jgi:hypothetical protein
MIANRESFHTFSVRKKIRTVKSDIVKDFALGLAEGSDSCVFKLDGSFTDGNEGREGEMGLAHNVGVDKEGTRK